MTYQVWASIPLAWALILSSPLAAHAQSAGSEKIEGRPALTLPFDGTVSGYAIGEDPELIFRLYDQETGGNLLFEERQTPHLTNGSYRVLIGAATPDGIPAAILQSDSTIWIDVSGSGAALDHTPRVLASAGANTKDQPMASSPSAELSETVPDPINQVPPPANFHLRNVATDLCLDTNGSKAFPQICQPSSNSQEWSEWYRIAYRGTSTKIHLKNFETQHCLESNRAGQVSANLCEMNNNSQIWTTRAVTAYGALVTFQNFANGSCLSVNSHGDLVTGECNSPDLHPLWAREPARVVPHAVLNTSLANAAITQTYVGKQHCDYGYLSIFTGKWYGGQADLQIVRWDNPGTSTRVFQLNVKADNPVAEIKTQEVDATTGKAMGDPWDLSKYSSNFYIQDNLGANGNGRYWRFGPASHHYYLWIWLRLNTLVETTCSLKYYYY